MNKLKVMPKSFAIPFGMRRFVTKEQIEYLDQKFDCIAYGEPGMLFNQKRVLYKDTLGDLKKASNII